MRETPGVSIGELRRRSRLGWGTFYHHLDRLTRARLVATKRQGRHRLAFPGGARADARVEERVALLHPTRRGIADHIHRHPGARTADVAAALGISRRSVHHHVRRLRQAGLVGPRGPYGSGLVPSPRLAPALLGHGD